MIFSRSLEVSVYFCMACVRVYISVPGPVSLDSLKATAKPTYIQLEWDQPSEPNGVILNYTITYQYLGSVDGWQGGDSSEGPKNISTDSGATSINITTEPYSIYTFKVFASTKVGTGEASGDFNQSTPVGGWF